MKEQVLSSKLCMPRIVCNSIQRERLLGHIHHASEPVVIFHAAMGYGKTTTMAEYVRTYGISYSWYQIDWADNDIQRFLMCFETLFRRKEKRFQFHEEPEEWSRRTVELVAESILEQLELYDEEWNIILDDFQYIEEPLIHYFLRFFIQYMGNRIRIFFLLRGEFPGFLTKFVLQGVAIVVEERDLRITKEELEAYLRESGNEYGVREVANPILESTEGWAVAVNDALTHQGITPGNEERAASYLDMSRLSNYLLYEILNPLALQQQIFMAESALLVLITPEVCNYVFDMSAAKGILDFFASRQLLLQKKSENEYRYHSVLKEFLCERVEKERKREIWRRAAEYYLRLQEYDQAMIYQRLLEDKVTRMKTLKTRDLETRESYELLCFGEIRIGSGDRYSILHWRTRKTKEMFAYFWEQQGRWLTKDEIIDVLWQEGDGQKLEALFHTTISYLKRTFSEIGISNLIQVESKRYRLQEQKFHSDNQKLRQLYENWKLGNQELDIEKDFCLLNQIYQGEYMKDIDGSWVIASRERYQDIYIKCCELLVNRANQMQKQDLAVRILEQTIEWDPYSEHLNGMLLKCLGDMGEFQAAKRQYEKYMQLMQDELNIEIDSKVSEIYRNVVERRIG